MPYLHCTSAEHNLCEEKGASAFRVGKVGLFVNLTEWIHLLFVLKVCLLADRGELGSDCAPRTRPLGLPGELVTLPGELVNSPGELVNLPGELVTLPGEPVTCSS